MINKTILKINSCLISVSDKTGINRIAKKLNDKGINIISTGNTYKNLKDFKIKVKKIEKVTSFPEILDGRVKTLHPKIFGGILADTNKKTHKNQLEKYGISKIQLVIVNLYPFEKISGKLDSIKSCIENIDVGGPSIIRAAAKNYITTAVLTDREDYDLIIKEIDKFNGITLDTRKFLASKAFYRTMEYDFFISKWFSEKIFRRNNDDFFLFGSTSTKLRYGENPHQNAYLLKEKSVNSNLFYTQLNGKTLSYNNFNDLHSGLNLISEFKAPTCVIIKHAIPCGVSEASSISKAWVNAYHADRLSAFGGVVVLNRALDLNTAKLLSKIFLEVVAAPSFSLDALGVLKTKSNIRLLKIKSIKKYSESSKKEIKMLSNCFLVQDRDKSILKQNQLNLVSTKKPSKRQLEDLLFANKVVKHVRSNAIVLAKNKITLGIGSGNTSRVDSVNFAIEKSSRVKTKNKNTLLKDSIMASDAFFPFEDSIRIAYKNGISAVIQPGGSINDKKVISEVNNSKMSMIFTKVRSFSH